MGFRSLGESDAAWSADTLNTLAPLMYMSILVLSRMKYVGFLALFDTATPEFPDDPDSPFEKLPSEKTWMDSSGCFTVSYGLVPSLKFSCNSKMVALLAAA
jgi:hypothetical protein